MAKKLEKKGEAESRRLYKSLFGDNSDAKEEEGVEEYQRNLQERVYKNGGQLRDYQSVGVSWLMANLVNKRSSILADEMGTFSIFASGNESISDWPQITNLPLSTRPWENTANCIFYQSHCNHSE